MATQEFTEEEADLCAQLHPGIALSRAADNLTDDRIRQLSGTHSYKILLHASHRLQPDELRQLAAVHPSECIIILESHPESRLRFSFRALHDGLNPNVARALDKVSSPAG